MMDAGKLDLRYVTRRTNRNGKVRRYWQRPGQALTRLPDGPEWSVRATELNQDVDHNPDAVAVLPETVGWAIREYRDSDRYKDASDGTKRAYEIWLQRYEAMWGNVRCRGITRKIIVEFLDTTDLKKKRPMRKLAAAVLRNVLNVAHNKGVIEINPCARLNLAGNAPRQALWSDDDLKAFEREAVNHEEGDAAVRYNMLLLYTGQRPVDVRAMERSSRKDGLIRVRQQKTGALVDIPEHHYLTAELAKPSNSLRWLVARKDGTPLPAVSLNEMCLDIRRKCGLGHLQQRDLRRTAVVRLAEAGCTVPEVAAITGHTIEQTTQILETYLPRTLPMARAAILKWERFGNEKS